MMNPLFDVLIVGAGPTGLMTAVLLAKYGLKIHIIDQKASPVRESKAIALQARTLEIFEHLDIVSPFLEESIRIHGANIYYKQKRRVHFSLDTIPSKYPFVISIEQYKTEKILQDALKKEGISVQWDTKLINFSQTPSGISAIVQSGSEESTITASYLIGADGAHSFVRKKLSFAFEGSAFSQVFSIADVYMKFEENPHEIHSFLRKDGFLALFPLPGKHHFRMIYLPQQGKEKKERKDFPTITLESLQREADVSIPYPVEIEKILWASHFMINTRKTLHFQKNRVFLLGDAAHIHSPAGGQGMNTGLQDAYNLVWKLALTHRKILCPDLLETYDTERSFVGKTLLKSTKGFSQLIVISNPFMIFFRLLFLRLINASKFLQKKLGNFLSETQIVYPSSKFWKKTHRFLPHLIGKRAPNVFLSKRNSPIELAHILQNYFGFTLIVFSPHLSSQEYKSFHEIEQAYPHLRCLYIIEKKSRLPAAEIFRDVQCHFSNTYGIKKPAIFLLRPDHYIGYIQKGLNTDMLQKTLSKIFL